MLYPEARSKFWEAISDIVIVNGEEEHKLHRMILGKSAFFLPMIDPSSDFFTNEPISIDVHPRGFELLFRYLYREVDALPKRYFIGDFVREYHIGMEDLLMMLMVTQELGFFDYLDGIFGILDFAQVEAGDLASLVEIFGYQKIPKSVIRSIPSSTLEQYPHLLYAYYGRQYNPDEKEEVSLPQAIGKVQLRKPH